jgi:hypothetical protein
MNLASVMINLKKIKFTSIKMIVIGFILGFLYWYVESLIHYFLMGEGHDPFSHLLHLEPYDLVMRLGFILFILSICTIIQISINRSKKYNVILIGILLTICFWILYIICYFHLFMNFGCGLLYYLFY